MFHCKNDLFILKLQIKITEVCFTRNIISVFLLQSVFIRIFQRDSIKFNIKGHNLFTHEEFDQINKKVNKL